ncbi:hypothetical protein DFA_00045 [Cavenderia fasciculata]|uniref:Uncharacterized protein n=1 Tax=Cavenderia fasciculata TaxID=261658 RepID=F4PXF8_CACFS|nr:uncharacterized protein DFA_00045 [Cavenderia fasciculata]EGG19468.1 hypothetical protein DFA_00045 [Cavenderia fasciculata]|eukprot:XP_004357762.1 hypothetical protein DFA_00045 [Cavenderia fasciculata]
MDKKSMSLYEIKQHPKGYGIPELSHEKEEYEIDHPVGHKFDINKGDIDEIEKKKRPYLSYLCKMVPDYGKN